MWAIYLKFQSAFHIFVNNFVKTLSVIVRQLKCKLFRQGLQEASSDQ